MRSRSNGGVIGAYALPTQNFANGVFFIHDAAIYNTGNNPIWPLAAGLIYSATGGTITNAVDNSNYKTHTFTANGTFSVVTGSGYIDILLVGGGGAGGGVQTPYASAGFGGGGGGGSVVLVSSVLINGPISFTVEIGAGGAGVSGSYTATTGGTSKITSSTGYYYTAPGGSGGNSINYTSINIGSPSGSSGGGASGWSSFGTSNGPSAGSNPNTGKPYSSSFLVNAGGAGLSGITLSGPGGGGGAAHAGYDGNYGTDASLQSCGGDGYLWSRTNNYYGAGGPGSPYTNYAALSGKYGNAYQYLKYGNSNSNSIGNDPTGYGVGGPGAWATAGGGINPGGSGYSGTVIFCYRYK